MGPAEWVVERPRLAGPSSPLRHFSGIQFHLEQDFRLMVGHTCYPDSEWALSSISQAQFRLKRPDWRDEHRGIRSVDIGNWSLVDPDRVQIGLAGQGPLRKASPLRIHRRAALPPG